MQIVDTYELRAPGPQNVVDIFKGEWSSKMPDDSSVISSPGPSRLFDDSRIHWLSKTIGGFSGKNVLEIGPLEGGHTYMLHDGGADSIVSVESNSRSFLKCLCVKELFNLSRARFLYGDCIQYLESCDESFELGVASGILYHMENPLRLIDGLKRTCQTIFVWTHYYDADRIAELGGQTSQFSLLTTIEHDGKTYAGARRNYGQAVNWAGFSGSSAPETFWLTREDLFGAFEERGLTIKSIEFDHPNHQNGPSIAFIAERSQSSPKA